MSKGAFVRQHTKYDTISPHLRAVLDTVMGDQAELIEQFANEEGITVYVKEHNCSIVGWMAVSEPQVYRSAQVVGAGAIQPGRLREDFTLAVATAHGAKELTWKVNNPVHAFIKEQLGFGTGETGRFSV